MAKYTASQMAAIEAAASDRLSLANSIRPLLSIAGVPLEGEDVRDLVAGGSDGRVVEATDTEPGIQLTATVAGTIEPNGQEERMDFLIGEENPVLLPGYVGRIVHTTRVPMGTEIEAQTTAYHWQRTPLGVDTEYLNTPANVAAYSALQALSQRYAAVQIPPSIAEPPVTAQGEDAIGEFDYIADVIDLVEGQDDAKIRRVLDTSLNVATAYPMKPVEASGAAVWEIREGEDCGFGEVEVSPADEERWYAVVVFRQLEDGMPEELARVRVDNGDAEVSPTDVLVIEYTQTEETEEVQESAFAMAFNEAMRRGKDMRKLTVPLCYWPIWIERGDLVSVETREFTGLNPESDGERGSIFRRYLMRVEGYRWGPERKEGQLTGEGLLLSETFVADEDITRLTDSPIASLLWGYDYAERGYFDASLPWLTVYEGYGEFDPERAAERGVHVTQANGMGEHTR